MNPANEYLRILFSKSQIWTTLSCERLIKSPFLASVNDMIAAVELSHKIILEYNSTKNNLIIEKNFKGS